jgi:hypothetical protein
MKRIPLISPVPRTKPFVLGRIRAYFDVFIFLMISVALLSPIPRTKPFVLADIRVLSAVFRTNPSLF